MNDIGLEDVIQSSEFEVKEKARQDEGKTKKADQNSVSPLKDPDNSREHLPQRPEHHKRGVGGTRHDYDEEDDEEALIYQSKLWWFASTAFPLFAGTFGPIANLFSVCSLSETWRVTLENGRRLPDPHWLIIMNAVSLFLALVANLVLLFNFARRIPYFIAQPITIIFWYLAFILLVIPICLVHESHKGIGIFYSQAYYYGLISCALYFIVSTLLLISTLGSVVFHAYPPSFHTLTGPQRTLMLQTISFSLYLSLGAGIFSRIEGWDFSDGVYWADYTLLTIGLGTDFPLTTTLSRMLIIPYAAVGITLIGLVVSSVRGLLLERAKAKVVRRHLEKERQQWKENIQERRRRAVANEMTTNQPMSTHDSHTPLSPTQRWLGRRRDKQLMRLPNQLEKHRQASSLNGEDQVGPWHRAEFELMRHIEMNAENVERYSALGLSFFVVLLLWIGGSLVFWRCEHKIYSWTYPQSIYFTYTTLLTIGYGDFYPNSPAGKPFFVVWSLISVPAMTVLISNMGDTVVKWVQAVMIWAGGWTILPEKVDKKGKEKKRKWKRKWHEKMGGHIIQRPSLSTATTSATNDSAQTGTRRRSGESILQNDVERLGNAVERFEEEEGRGGSLSAQLAREIANLAKDMRSSPLKKHTWDDWSRWLDMLGERKFGSEQGKAKHGLHGKTKAKPRPAPILVVPYGTGDSVRTDGPPEFEDAESHSRMNAEGGAEQHEEDWQWTWLADHGPLFSTLTETEWILEKLCFRLEEVLEDEIKEARASANPSGTRVGHENRCPGDGASEKN